MEGRRRAKLPTITVERAKTMRSAPTDAEHRLWQHLRGGRRHGLKFRRQHPVPPYIADFFCDALKLLVEVDGSQHSESVDARRTRSLESRGFRIVRFQANDVLVQTEAVLEASLNIPNVPPLTPTPLPEGEGP